jgi:hypothetical protein
MKSWVQTLMNVCINVCNVYIHDVSCINMIYETCMMVSEYLQNIVLNKSRNNNNKNNIKLWHLFLSHYAMKKLQFMTQKKKKKV